MKVLALTRYGKLGASSRLRTFQYIPLLESQGITVDVSSLLSDQYLRLLYKSGERTRTQRIRAYAKRLVMLTRSRQYDIIWIEKELFPWFPAMFERFLGQLSTPYVVDYDDAIFHNYDKNRLKIVRMLLGDKIRTVMKCSALVTAGNEYLADYARRAGAGKVEIMPTVINLEKYRIQEKSSEINRRKLTIGWIGTPVTFKYLSQLQSVLEDYCIKNDAKVVAVGGGTQVPWKQDVLCCKEWREETETEELHGFDIGIMPVTDDQAWSRGKCGYKLIQYMGCGKPVIASPVGVNKTIVKHGVSGYLAQSYEEWLLALTKLGASSVDRQQMGRHGRTLVEQEFSLQVTAPRLQQLLIEASHNRHKK